MACMLRYTAIAALFLIGCSDTGPAKVLEVRIIADATFTDANVAGGDATDVSFDLQAPSIVQLRVWSLGPLAGIDAALSAPGAAPGTVAWSGVSGSGALTLDAFRVTVPGRWTLHVRWLQGQGAASYRFSVLHEGGSPFDQAEPFDIDLLEAEQKTPRVGHTATALPDGRVLIAGGGAADGTNAQRVTSVLASALLVDPVGRAVSPAGALDVARAFHTATYLPSGGADFKGRVLVTGGLKDNGDANITTELYDPVDNSFTAGPVMSTARAFHAALYVTGTKTFLDDTVLIFGGERARGGPQLYYFEWVYTEIDATPSDLFYFSPLSGQFNELGDAGKVKNVIDVNRKVTGLLLPALAQLQDGRILILGGAYNALPSRPGCHENPDSICKCTSDALPLCTDWRCSGEDCTYTNYGFKALATAEVLVYDVRKGSSDLYMLPTTMRRARVGHTATVLPDGNVLIVGGATAMRRRFTDAEGYLAEFPRSIDAVEMFEPGKDQFRILPPLAFPREQHAAVLLAGGQVALVGGLYGVPGGITPLAAVELYSPATGRFDLVTLLSEARGGAAAVAVGTGSESAPTSVFVSGGLGASGTLVSGELLELHAAPLPE